MGGSILCVKYTNWNYGRKNYILHSISVKIKSSNTIISKVLPTKNIIAKVDSATSKHYWWENDISCFTILRPYSGPSVTLPDVDMIAPS